ncbi:hypothetical protein [Paenibacillus sp. GYB003]|uniref:hypothetical protein n=1 Tax=Paenibacillus sp. GYB003 TaxID=2994392 RepID=UPI002F96986D
MSDPGMKMLSDIAVKVGKLEALQETNARAIHDMATGLNRLINKLDQSDDIAREADLRAKSAHQRIDEVKLESDKKWSGVQADIEWLWRTVLAAVITGAISGAAAFVWGNIG